MPDNLEVALRIKADVESAVRGVRTVREEAAGAAKGADRLGKEAAGAAKGADRLGKEAAAAARWLRLSGEAREHTGLMAPSHALRRSINDHIRERLARDSAIRGPALEIDRLVSHGYTTAEKSLAAHYAPGDVVGFQRDYRSLGAEKGDERRVVGVDHATGTVMLEGRNGEAIPWQPRRVGGRRGAVEVYRAETIELLAGDRIRWTRNDIGLGLVNSHTAEVHSVEGGGVSFRLENGRMLALGKDAPQLRHLDHAWASTVHAFQGRTVS